MGYTSEQNNCREDEKPVHPVNIEDFQISKFEVTQAQWRAVMGSDPEKLKFKGCDKCPEERVSWNGVLQFLQKLNELTRKSYRRPSESEWEFAARGGQNSKGFRYSGSNNLQVVAWFIENSEEKTHPVGGRKPNELGVYDMSGNVEEWCQDVYQNNYNGAPDDGSAWEYKGVNRVIRGGSWFFSAVNCRVSFRHYWLPNSRYIHVGFRLAHS